MNKIVQFLTSALVLTLATPASSLNLTPSLVAAISDAAEASRAHTTRPPFSSRAAFAISKIDGQMVDLFGHAWRQSGNGSLPLEGVVLIVQMADGGYAGIELGSTNEHKRFTFNWREATIAIVHTHPNTSDPRPQDEDIAVANKHNVPVFTITSRGMYVYDPGARKTSKVMSDVAWLEVSNWKKGLFAKR